MLAPTSVSALFRGRTSLPKRAASAFLLATVCLSVLGGYTALAAAQGSSAGTDSSRQRSLSALRLELKELDTEFERVDAQADDVVGRVGRLRKAIEIQQLRVTEAQAALAQAIEGVAAAERKLAAVEALGQVLKHRLQRRSRRLYQLGRWGSVRMFFSLSRDSVAASSVAAPTPDPLAGLRLLRAVVRQDARGMAEVEANRLAAVAASADLDRSKQEAHSWLDEQREVISRLAARRREEQAALGALAQRRTTIEEQLSGVRNRHDRLNRLLEILAAEGAGGLGGLPIEDFRGALDWPVLGPLNRRFGPYRDAQYGTLVPHNGLTIATQFRDTVRAVYPGRVVYAGQFRDVGLVVVLQHSRDALSMYSGLTQAAVSEGDIVALGDAVGAAARELYFEIRAGRTPEDPLVWLSAAG